MRFTWTMKELKEISNKRLISVLIAERKTTLNPYAPLARRLVSLQSWVENHVPED